MPVVFIRRDPFADDTAVLREVAPSSSNRGVRRPLYGYLPKGERFASISVLQSGEDGGLVPLSILDSGGVQRGADARGYSTSNHNFFVTAISHSDQEKMQIIETFGDDHVFFFGRRPLAINVSGMLMNTEDFGWKSEWLENYDRYLRGTRCVQNRTRVYLRIDDMLYSGYMFKTDVSDGADLPHVSPFSFQMLVFQTIDLSSKMVQSFFETRTVGSGNGSDLYVDYVEGPATESALYQIDPSTGVSTAKLQSGDAITASFALTEAEVIRRLDRTLSVLGDIRAQHGEIGLSDAVLYYDPPRIQDF